MSDVTELYAYRTDQIIGHALHEAFTGIMGLKDHSPSDMAVDHSTYRQLKEMQFVIDRKLYFMEGMLRAQAMEANLIERGRP